jgi:hypothetical protein
MIDFLIKITGCFVLSTMISILAAFVYFFINSIIINLFNLNYSREGAYWTFSYVFGMILLTWVFLFGYFMRHI